VPNFMRAVPKITACRVNADLSLEISVSTPTSRRGITIWFFGLVISAVGIYRNRLYMLGVQQISR
jgi:hypothetical protein